MASSHQRGTLGNFVKSPVHEMLIKIIQVLFLTIFFNRSQQNLTGVLKRKVIISFNLLFSLADHDIALYMNQFFVHLISTFDIKALSSRHLTAV